MALEQTTPPGIQLDGPVPSKAPVTPDGGFFFAPEKVLIKPAESPLDIVTGLPLPIAAVHPSQMPQPFSPRNWHHHFHPESSPALQSSAGLAIRNSRVQYMRQDVHQRYHDFFTGPPLPQSEEEAFRAVVLAIAGVVPRQALDFSIPGEYSIITVDDDEYFRLARPETMHPDRRGVISKFLAYYTTREGIEDQVSGVVIREFLSDKTTRARKLELARTKFLSGALELSLQAVAQEHQDLRQEGLVVQSKRKTAYSVVRRFIRQYALVDFSEALSKHLATI